MSINELAYEIETFSEERHKLSSAGAYMLKHNCGVLASKTNLFKNITALEYRVNGGGGEKNQGIGNGSI